MSPRVLLSLAWRSVRRNVFRSLLTILGVVIGVASVVVMVAVGLGAQSEVTARINNLGTNLVVITPGATTTGGVSGGSGSFNRLTVDDSEFLAKESTLLAAVSPVVQTRGLVIAGNTNWRSTINGVDVSYPEIRAWEVASGRFFTKEEVRARRKVALLGQTTAKALFADSDPVGSQIRIGQVPVEVIGVLAAKGQTAEGTDQDDIILAPYTTVQTRMSGRVYIAQILGSALSSDDVPDAVAEVKELMRESHGLGANDPDDITVRDQSSLGEAAKATTRVMTLLLSAVASISLLVGGIGIMNIMLVSVTERTLEIGIRRALGARSRDVLAQFLVESVVLSGFGGLLGATLGVTGAWILGAATGWATQVSPATLALAMGFAIGVGVFFGWYPARRAAALDVIEALRHQ